MKYFEEIKFKSFQKTVKCKECGAVFYRKSSHSTHNSHVKKMVRAIKEELCLNCLIWNDYIKSPPSNMEIIDGVAYTVNPKAKKKLGSILGGGGELKFILKKDGTVLESNDIWTLGKVPMRFRDRLPNTGWWITPRYGSKLLKDPFVCRGKACYDRYHCYRYDYRSEYEKGPFNAIPKHWVPGGEECRSFVPLGEIKNFDEYVNINDMSVDDTKS